MKLNRLVKEIRGSMSLAAILPGKYQFAGRLDALSLATIWPSLGVSLPIFNGDMHLAAASIVAAGVGGAMAASPRAERDLSKIEIDSKEGFVLKSDDVYGKDQEGVHVGFTLDNNEPVTIPYDFFMRHFALVGGSGVGKTTLGMYVLWQQIAKGGGFIFIDAKVDTDTRDALGYFARVCGREDELQIINVDKPDESNTYNPLIEGDPDDVASRLLNLLPSAENNAGADFYRQTVFQALLSLIGALQRAKIRFTFEDLTIMLQSGRAMEDILQKLKKQEALEGLAEPSSERRTFEIFIDKYRKQGRNGPGEIDTSKVKEAFGGMIGRASAFSQGKFGQIFNHYCPEVDLTKTMLNNQMLYVMLPTMGKDNSALSLGKMLLSDLRTAVYNLQGKTKAERPWPPFVVFADEMGSYVMPGIARLFEQARSAQVALMPGFQAYGNLDAVGPDFKDIIMQNTWSKALYRSGSNESATEGSEIIGEVIKYQYTFSESSSSGASSPGNKFNPQFNESDNSGEGISYKEAKEARVEAGKMGSLGVGESIIKVGSRVYHCRVPRLLTPMDDEKPGEPRKEEYIFKPMKTNPKMPRGWSGLNFAGRYKEFIADMDMMEATPGRASQEDVDKVKAASSEKNNKESRESDS